MSAIKAEIMSSIKQAMKDKNAGLLGTLRLMSAAIKQIEVDERIELDDARVLSVLEKMCKQRRDSMTQFEAAHRPELAQKEQEELTVILSYMPTPLTEGEVRGYIQEALAATGAAAVSDMGRVMALLKPKVQGRADMAQVGAWIKEALSH